MTADEQAYAELCVGCIREKTCHEDDTKLCDVYLRRVDELKGVVQVVRCKDCAIPHNRWTGCPRMNGTIMRPDDYCSYGKRKEDE